MWFDDEPPDVRYEFLDMVKPLYITFKRNIHQAQTKGQRAEESVYDMIPYRKEIKADIPNSGDFWVFKNGKIILCEVKNYLTVVPGKELEKFRNDIRVNGVNCGLFISYGKMTGIKGSVYLQYADNVPLVYVDISKFPDVSGILCSIIKLLSKSPDFDNMVELTEFVAKINVSINLITDCENSIKTMRTAVNRLAKNLRSVKSELNGLLEK